MTSEIRVNKIENRSGLGTVTFADTGVDLAGIVTATTFSGSGASLTGLPAGNLTGTVADARISTLTASKLSGALPAISAASLTNVPAANITGTLPALTAANLTNIPAANIVGVCTSGLTKTGGFGKILQVVQGTKTTGTSASSATYGDLGLSVAITPQTNSKVLALINIQSGLNSSNNSGFGVKLLRDSTAVYTSNTDYDVQNNTSATSDGRFRNSWHILDSSVGGDGSTSFTYKIQVATHGGRSVSFSDGNNLCTITLFEIGA